MSNFQRERGPWKAITTSDKRAAVESDDFTHDVRLYVDGDFADMDQRMSYARAVATALNAAMPLKPE